VRKSRGASRSAMQANPRPGRVALSDAREPVRIAKHDFCFNIPELPEHSLPRCSTKLVKASCRDGHRREQSVRLRCRNRFRAPVSREFFQSRLPIEDADAPYICARRGSDRRRQSPASPSLPFRAGVRLFRLPHVSADIALFDYLLLDDLPHLFERCAPFRRGEQLRVRSLH
jgi:hypothetical protein